MTNFQFITTWCNVIAVPLQFVVNYRYLEKQYTNGRKVDLNVEGAEEIHPPACRMLKRSVYIVFVTTKGAFTPALFPL